MIMYITLYLFWIKLLRTHESGKVEIHLRSFIYKILMLLCFYTYRFFWDVVKRRTITRSALNPKNFSKKSDLGV